MTPDFKTYLARSIATLAILAIVIIGTAEATPVPFSYSATEDFPNQPIDIDVSSSEKSWAAFTAVDLSKQDIFSFASVIAAGSVIIVEFGGAGGGDPVVQEYTTSATFDSQFSSLVSVDPISDNLEVVINSENSVSLSISGNLTGITLPFGTSFDELQFEFSFYHSTEVDANGNPVLPNEWFTFWEYVTFTDEITIQELPTSSPTRTPTEAPTNGPTSAPVRPETNEPTETPSEGPTSAPVPLATNQPTEVPSSGPTSVPTKAPVPAGVETPMPTFESFPPPPSEPTTSPTIDDDIGVSGNETEPTARPTSAPTSKPSSASATTHSLLGIFAVLTFGVHMISFSL